MLLFAALAAGLLAPVFVHAQDYPVRTIRYIVPQAPGGSSDTLARVIAPRLADALGISRPANSTKPIIFPRI